MSNPVCVFLRGFIHSIPVFRRKRLGEGLICGRSGKSISQPVCIIFCPSLIYATLSGMDCSSRYWKMQLEWRNSSLWESLVRCRETDAQTEHAANTGRMMEEDIIVVGHICRYGLWLVCHVMYRHDVIHFNILSPRMMKECSALVFLWLVTFDIIRKRKRSPLLVLLFSFIKHYPFGGRVVRDVPSPS